jgi:hypothetical protein
VIQFVSDLRQSGGFPRVLRSPPPGNIVESGVKHNKPSQSINFHLYSTLHIFPYFDLVALVNNYDDFVGFGA